MMSIRFLFCVCLGVGIILFSSGCVVQRTIKEDGVVVDRGYVVKAPL